MLDGFKFGESEDEIVRKKKGVRHLIRVFSMESEGRSNHSIWFIADADPTKGFIPSLDVVEAIKRFNASGIAEKNFIAFGESDKTKKYMRVLNAYHFDTDAYLTLDNYAQTEMMLEHLEIMNQVLCEEIHNSL
jgi:hypothetical protein